VRTTFLCDFDGTIAPRDIGAEFVRRFAQGGVAERAALLASWTAGSIGSRELTEGECAWVRVSGAEAEAFVEEFTIDPSFAPFARWALAAGAEVQVVSDGFEFYIDRLLARAGLAGLPVTSNRLRFDGGRVRPEFPNAGLGCGRCGNCKSVPARAARARGARVVLVGDGYSDRCAAELADHVLARGALAEWCAARGIAVRTFASFADVERFARALPD
jgi:2,3-diketo-5-methylthio-1-phosphopentane phosphatase